MRVTLALLGKALERCINNSTRTCDMCSDSTIFVNQFSFLFIAVLINPLFLFSQQLLLGPCIMPVPCNDRFVGPFVRPCVRPCFRRVRKKWLSPFYST